jgi:ATP-dependent Lhr-like helicase
VTRLWRERFVEAVVAPVAPWHLMAQQAMAMVLERGAVPADELMKRVAALFPELPEQTVAEVLAQMCAEKILFEDAGVLAFGGRGEQLFGRQHFIELVSSFDSPPLLLARHGAAEIGFVDPLTLQVDAGERPRVLSLGGRGWRVLSIEWNRKIVWVEPTADEGKSRWFGARAALGFAVCQAIQRELADEQASPLLSRRGRERFAVLGEAFPTHEEGSTALESLSAGRWRWWTFAGLRANRVLRQTLAQACGPIREDDFGLEGQGTIELAPAMRARLLESLPNVPLDVPLGPEADIKFGECLPESLLHRMLGLRRADLDGARSVLERPLVQFRAAPPEERAT